jgi:hypothetical protein
MSTGTRGNSDALRFLPVSSFLRRPFRFGRSALGAPQVIPTRGRADKATLVRGVRGFRQAGPQPIELPFGGQPSGYARSASWFPSLRVLPPFWLARSGQAAG